MHLHGHERLSQWDAAPAKPYRARDGRVKTVHENALTLAAAVHVYGWRQRFRR
jgi:hypothetical protein